MTGNAAATTAAKATYDVYIHERGKRPRLLSRKIEGKIPPTITEGDRTYYWAGGDLSERTMTYVDIKPGAKALA